MTLRDVLNASSCVKETIVVSACEWIVREFTDDIQQCHETNENLMPYMDVPVYSIGVLKSDCSLFIILCTGVLESEVE